jgi:penicillin-binding protein 1A
VTAVPIFTEFMTNALKDKPAEDFPAPANAKYAMVNGIREAFRPGTEPQGYAGPLGAAGSAGPVPYDKLGATPGAPGAAVVAPTAPAAAPPPKKKDDLSDLY